jgi:beta-glucosidase
VEHLSEAECVLKALEAGVNQFGGESCAHYVVDLVRSGRLSKARVDQSVRRLLRLKFALGLFDNPFMDETQVVQVMDDPAAVAAGLESQKRAMVLLKNADGVLPLSGRLKIYVKNIDPTVAGQYVKEPAKSDILTLLHTAPTIVVIYLDRPAVIPEISAAAQAPPR